MLFTVAFEVSILASPARARARLRRALRMANQLGTLDTLQSVSLELLDANPAGVLLLDISGRTIYANRAATAIAQAGDGFALGAGGAILLRRSDNDKLRTLIGRAVIERAGGAMPALRPSGRRAYSITVSPLTVGRSHGVHAEPITFGFKAAGWFAELERNAERLQRAGERIAVGKISGAVGSHANVSAEVERHVCELLGLAPDPAATQVVSRDRHAELLTSLAILGGTLERISVEVRHLQRTEVAEAFEPFGASQQGSSAMPHKRNPILAERVSGLARLLRADALVGLENMALWHERDISHSSAERFVFERALGVAAYATRLLATVLDGLEVDAERMSANLDLSGGMVYSEALLLAMIAKGADRQEAYRLVQGAAHRALANGTAFHDELQMALHLYLINRGILITPFHNMTLCCPATSADDVDRLIATLDQALTELLAIPGARV